MEKIKEILSLFNICVLFIHPFLIAISSFFSWIKLLWHSRILFNGRWGNYNCCKPDNSLNKFFYLTQWLNIERYGLTGISPVVGLGNYSLAKWFHISLLSSFLFANAGFLTILLGTMLWCLTSFAWVVQIQWQWASIVFFIQFFSCFSYFLASYASNYNIVGWIWMPISIFGVFTKNPILVCISLLLGSLGSMTMVVGTTLLIAPYCLFWGEMSLLLALIPAYLKLSTHVIPLISRGNLKVGLENTAKLIGLTKASAKYKRTIKILSLSSVYYVLLNLFAIFVLWMNQGNIFFPLTGIVIYLINQTFFRFMDIQSCYMLIATSFAASVLATPWSWPSLIAFLFVVNPLPRFLFGRFEKGSIVKVPSLKPFNHSELLDELNSFLGKVPQKSRVIMAFDDPGSNYSMLFDGLKVLKEPLLFVASAKNIHLFPDWYSVAETNYIGAPNFWGRSLVEVRNNMHLWHADYAIVYTEDLDSLDFDWQLEFDVVATFDWKKWEKVFFLDCPWGERCPPKWWLLIPKSDCL